MDVRSNLNTDARLTAGLLALREGAFARATGHAACLNPYASVAANADRIGDAPRAESKLCSRAWQKGWDDEELRRRPHQPIRRGGGVLILPWLLDGPLQRGASTAELGAARSGGDFEIAGIVVD